MRTHKKKIHFSEIELSERKMKNRARRKSRAKQTQACRRAGGGGAAECSWSSNNCFNRSLKIVFGAAALLLKPLIFISYLLICFAWSLISDLFAAAEINLDVTPVCYEARQDVVEDPGLKNKQLEEQLESAEQI